MVNLSFDTLSDLDSIEHTSAPRWIFDTQNQRMWWANTSGLAFWRAPKLSDLLAREFGGDSASVWERLAVISENIGSGEEFLDSWTLYPDGAPQDVVLSFRQVQLEKKRIGLMVEVVQQTAAAIDDHSTRIAEATRTSSAMITMMTLKGYVLAQNPAALKCYGPATSAHGPTPDIASRLTNKRDLKQVLDTAKENRSLRLEAEVVTLRGKRVHYISVKRGRDPITGDNVIVLSEEDISEITGLYSAQKIRSAELEGIIEDRTDKLRITQERIERALQLAAIWDWDIKEDNIFFSSNFIQSLEFEKEEFNQILRTEGFEGLILPEDYIGYPKILEEFLALPDTPLSHEMRFVTKSGKSLWIQIEGKCFRDENGAPFRTYGLLTDITRKKHLEETLVASRRLEAIGQLTGGIAHDFNNLLTVIQGNVQLLQEFGQADEELTSEIVNAVQRGADLTQHLLAFARKQSLNPEPFNIQNLLTRMRGTLLRILSEAIDVHVEGNDALWYVFADASQTEAAILNIALNARDVMPQGGKMAIRGENLVLTSDTIPKGTELEPGDYVRISITDTGTGMPPDVLAKVFEPFFTTKDVGKGSGLGLSMVLGFSQQSGGDTQIYSLVDVGTKVSIYLPRARVTRPDPGPSITAKPLIGAGEHVHILEDNQNVSSAVSRLISSLGYSVSTSHSADEALKVVAADKSSDIAVFLVDVILPGGRSGVDFANELLKIRPDAKLVLMSGYPEDELKRDIAHNFDFRFLPKPFSRNDISDALAATLKF